MLGAELYLSVAPVHDIPDARKHGVRLFDDVDDLKDRTAGRDDILDDQRPFARAQLEASTQFHLSVLSLREHRSCVEQATDLRTDYDAADGRR